ncbi:LRRF2 protein, partial [Polypterus senegalus]
MVSNAQLDNEKANLIYQVDTLKDVVEEMEEQMAEMLRENEEKSKELERQKHTCNILQHKVEELKEGIRQRDELIEALERQKEYFDCIRNERDELRDELADIKEKMKKGEKHGMVIIPEGTPNGDINHEPLVGAITVVTQEAAQVLESAGDGPLDVRLRKLADEKDELLSQIRKLKMQLEEERQKPSKIDSVFTDGERLENGTDLQLIELQRDANRQISEYKFKLSKAEQEIGTMEQNVNRLEGQVARYKAAAENSEKIEDELKAEKRKLQRETVLQHQKPDQEVQNRFYHCMTCVKNSPLLGIFYRTLHFLENGIKPVFIFDGCPPEQKEGLAPSDGEAMCAHLVKTGEVDAVASEDMDTLAFGSSFLIRQLNAKKGSDVIEYCLPKLLEVLNLTQEQFVDLCILLGCDYCEKIRGLGPKKALTLIQQHKSIEDVLLNINREVHPVPVSWKYHEARRIFLNPDVTTAKQQTLHWKEPDEEGLVKFLVHENYVKEERIRKRMEAFRKMKEEKLSKGESSDEGKYQQSAITRYFRVTRKRQVAAPKVALNDLQWKFLNFKNEMLLTPVTIMQCATK